MIEIRKLRDQRNKRHFSPNGYKYLIITDDDNVLSITADPDNGDVFFGSWTDNYIEFRGDKSIELLVDKPRLIWPEKSIGKHSLQRFTIN